MYKINYDSITGQPSSIQRPLGDGREMSIPFAEGNTDFQDFLVWNKEQEIPLDWQTAIEVIPPEKVITNEEKLDALWKQAQGDNSAMIAIELAESKIDSPLEKTTN